MWRLRLLCILLCGSFGLLIGVLALLNIRLNCSAVSSQRRSLRWPRASRFMRCGILGEQGVLWSRFARALPPLPPLLVFGIVLQSICAANVTFLSYHRYAGREGGTWGWTRSSGCSCTAPPRRSFSREPAPGSPAMGSVAAESSRRAALEILQSKLEGRTRQACTSSCLRRMPIPPLLDQH